MKREKELYKGLKPFMNCVDHTVSKESYELLLNKDFDMMVTLPVPSDLENYYKSETYISHTNANKSVLDKIYQKVRKRTLQKKVAILNSFNFTEKKVLDIGSGTGDFLATCKNANWNVFGVEPNEDARTISKSKDINVRSDILFLKETNFDVITLWHVLEHVENLLEYIEILKAKLKPNGVLLIAVPNYKSFDANYYKEFWAAFDVPRHLWHFSQTSIQKLFTNVSMKVEKTIPMKYDSYYVSMLSEKYKSGSTNFIKAFYIGFLSNMKAKSTSEYSSLIYVIKNRENSN
ncbi:putative S-adenosylmethionine-dependent methyltransferase/MSMEI_2290 [Polaribacter huanghezhanensis]|uniref:class I SAM-dependent methyltransferase n=1 Tax=Polaribacter huanghezhanensis TaxID=1354726 RepID=UPI0026487F09|nr:class I SAM-dependent methyltransferase [Polaribacter huanghezhanensis]WKD85512.1 putative S-adenosylmethionine-dependent methyltransferase/MSMEI_2290 [Polaribacter huanghezhanensis]